MTQDLDGLQISWEEEEQVDDTVAMELKISNPSTLHGN
jgi:hypothetical protein